MTPYVFARLMRIKNGGTPELVPVIAPSKNPWLHKTLDDLVTILSDEETGIGLITKTVDPAGKIEYQMKADRLSGATSNAVTIGGFKIDDRRIYSDNDESEGITLKSPKRTVQTLQVYKAANSGKSSSIAIAKIKAKQDLNFSLYIRNNNDDIDYDEDDVYDYTLVSSKNINYEDGLRIALEQLSEAQAGYDSAKANYDQCSEDVKNAVIEALSTFGYLKDEEFKKVIASYVKETEIVDKIFGIWENHRSRLATRYLYWHEQALEGIKDAYNQFIEEGIDILGKASAKLGEECPELLKEFKVIPLNNDKDLNTVVQQI